MSKYDFPKQNIFPPFWPFWIQLSWTATCQSACHMSFSSFVLFLLLLLLLLPLFALLVVLPLVFPFTFLVLLAALFVRRSVPAARVLALLRLLLPLPPLGLIHLCIAGVWNQGVAWKPKLELVQGYHLLAPTGGFLITPRRNRYPGRQGCPLDPVASEETWEVVLHFLGS